jgi:glycosyltransferase involved in cell wall biosynthesis
MRALRGAGHDLCLLTNVAGATEDHSPVVPDPVGRHPEAAEVARRIDDFAPDIVIIRNAESLSRHAAVHVRRRGIPALLYNLLPMTERPGLKRRLRHWAWRLPHERITPVPGLPPRTRTDPRAHYLPWPVARLPHPETGKTPHDRLRLLCVGKLGSKRKNQPALVSAIEDAGLETRVLLTLVGTETGGNAAHAETVRALSQRDWITLVPPMPFAEMARFHAEADACILPSFDEPLGVSPVESMAYGSVPMISSDAGSAGYLTQGKDGFVIDMHRPETLVSALREMLDADRRAELGQAALQTAEHELSEHRFLDRFHAILRGKGLPV